MPHAPLAPSSSERWMACPGSHHAEAAAPPSMPSVFADLGTHAHELFARGLRLGLAAEVLTTDPMIQHPLASALAATREILGPRSFLVEVRLPALAGLAAVWGTADVAAFSGIATAWSSRYGSQPQPFICVETSSPMPAPGCALIGDFWISTVTP